MQITHCKLRRNITRRLLEFFILEATAHSMADMLDMHPNSAVLFIERYGM